MVKSVEEILKSEFNRSISDPGVHIIDPFVGTGNFIVRIMEQIQRPALEDKYTSEIHCNEVMLLPYYIASMNIEHQFYEATGHYRPFEGICLVDTFELAEDRQFPLFAPANSQRVENQRKTPMFVIIGNPPYNVGQVNENDNNKNRQYPVVDVLSSKTNVQFRLPSDAQESTFRPVCQSDSVGIGPDWRRRSCGVRNEQQLSE